MKNLDKRAKVYWLIKNAIWLLLLCIPFTVARYFTEGTVQLSITITGGILLGLLVIFFVTYPFLKFNCYKYSLDSERFVIHRGVIFRHRIVVPVCQIQDLHVYEGPLMTAFHLNGIIISTAGSNFSLPCIEKGEAEQTVAQAEIYLKDRLAVIKDEEVL